MTSTALAEDSRNIIPAGSLRGVLSDVALDLDVLLLREDVRAVLGESQVTSRAEQGRRERLNEFEVPEVSWQSVQWHLICTSRQTKGHQDRTWVEWRSRGRAELTRIVNVLGRDARGTAEALSRVVRGHVGWCWVRGRV